MEVVTGTAHPQTAQAAISSLRSNCRTTHSYQSLHAGRKEAAAPVVEGAGVVEDEAGALEVVTGTAHPHRAPSSRGHMRSWKAAAGIQAHAHTALACAAPVVEGAGVLVVLGGGVLGLGVVVAGCVVGGLGVVVAGLVVVGFGVVVAGCVVGGLGVVVAGCVVGGAGALVEGGGTVDDAMVTGVDAWASTSCAGSLAQ